MNFSAVRLALENGAYCRSGDTGRGQVWQGGALLGVCGPAALRRMRDDPSLEAGTLMVYGVPRRVYVCSGVDPFGEEGNFTSAR